MRQTWRREAVATLTAVASLAAACGSSTGSTGGGAAAATSGRAVSSSATAASTTAVARTPVCPPLGGGDSAVRADLTAVDVHEADGLDVVVFTFTAPGGGALPALPSWRITSQSSATFLRDPSAITTTIDGVAGLKVVFSPATGDDVGLSPAVRTYTGPARITPRLAEIRDMEQIGDFERVLSWAIGLAAVRCPSVIVAPTKLTIKLATTS